MRFDIRCTETTASTNDEVKKAACSGAAEGLVVWALEQSAGRGRQGRTWQSPQGNLYFSILLRPPTPLRDWGKYSFVAGLAVGEAVEDALFRTAGEGGDPYSGEGEGMVGGKIAANILAPPSSSPLLRKSARDKKVELKWPNDVLVGGKKISGILLEAGEGWLVVGIGINVLHLPENPMYPVTSLAAEIVEATRNLVIPAKAGIQRVASATHMNQTTLQLDDILNKILASFDAWYILMNKDGFTPIRSAWLSRARKGTLRVRLPADEGEVNGEFVDLDDEGSLCLSLQDGTERRIVAGDVFS